MGQVLRSQGGAAFVIALTAAIWSGVAGADVVCDKFDFRSKVSGSTLELSLDTDLPDDTVLFVTVSRLYFEKGDSEECVHNYFSEKSTVGEWRVATDFSRL